MRTAATSKPGTWAYWPPEAFGRASQIGKPTDMWSLGVVLFVMLSGYHPFDPTGETDDQILVGRILDGEADFDDPVRARARARRRWAGLERGLGAAWERLRGGLGGAWERLGSGLGAAWERLGGA